MPMMVQTAQRSKTAPSRRAQQSAANHDAPIDWTHLSRFTLNDRSLELEVLRLFANDAPRYLAKVQSANSQREWAEAIHTLKGSARAVGAWAIAECAQAAEMLQRSAREGHDDHHSEPQANSCLKLAIEKLDEVVRSTLAYIDEIAPVPAEGTSIPA